MQPTNRDPRRGRPRVAIRFDHAGMTGGAAYFRSMPRLHSLPPIRTRALRDDGEIATSVDAFRRVLREIRVMARKGELSTGLSAAQTFVLSVLIERPGASLNELAESTLTDRSSVAAVVD